MGGHVWTWTLVGRGPLGPEESGRHRSLLNRARSAQSQRPASTLALRSPRALCTPWNVARCKRRPLRRLSPAPHHRKEICRRFASSGRRATATAGAIAAFFILVVTMICQMHSRGARCPIRTGGAPPTIGGAVIHCTSTVPVSGICAVRYHFMGTAHLGAAYTGPG